MSDAFGNAADDEAGMDDNAGNRIDAGAGDDLGNQVEGGAARATLEYVTKSIVDDPDAVVIDAEQSANGTMLRVHVAPDDKGKIIGKRGRVAIAVRTVVRAVGARAGADVSVDIADDD